MKLYELYFSPTGGTKKVTKYLSTAWTCEKEELDLMSGENMVVPQLDATDICIVAVPSYAGRVPAFAADVLKRISGNHAKAVLVAVYGNREFEDTLIELRDILENCGFNCIAAVAALAEHSIARQFAAGRPDAEDAKELQEFGLTIKEKMELAHADFEIQVPGNHPYRPAGNIMSKPVGTEECIKCGKCAEECPVWAIPSDNLTSVDKDRCMACMHCIAVCPKQARRVPEEILAGLVKHLEPLCQGRKQNQLFV